MADSQTLLILKMALLSLKGDTSTPLPCPQVCMWPWAHRSIDEKSWAQGEASALSLYFYTRLINALPSVAGPDGGGGSAAGLATLAAALQALHLPSAEQFADVDGCPVTDELPAGAEAFYAAAAAGLARTAAAAGRLDAEALAALALPCNPDAAHFAATGSGRSEGVRIEELPAAEGLGQDTDPTLCARLVLAGATYSLRPPLYTPWASPATHAAAGELLAQLAAQLEGLIEFPEAAAAAAATIEAVPPLQRWVLGVLPLALGQLRPALVGGGSREHAGEASGAAEAPGKLLNMESWCWGSPELNLGLELAVSIRLGS